MLPEDIYGNKWTVNDIFHEIDTRVFALKHNKSVPNFHDKYYIIQNLQKYIFGLDPEDVLNKIEHLLEQLANLRENWNAKSKDDDFFPFEMEEPEYYSTELTDIKSQILENATFLKRRAANSPSDSKTRDAKIKTNLSVDQLAVLFKILHEFDKDNSEKERILKDYDVTWDLFRDIAATFSSKKADAISPKSIDSAYGDNYQDATVDFWIEKFTVLSKAAGRMRHEIINKKDMPKKRK